MNSVIDPAREDETESTGEAGCCWHFGGNFLCLASSRDGSRARAESTKRKDCVVFTVIRFGRAT